MADALLAKKNEAGGISKGERSAQGEARSDVFHEERLAHILSTSSSFITILVARVELSESLTARVLQQKHRKASSDRTRSNPR